MKFKLWIFEFEIKDAEDLIPVFFMSVFPLGMIALIVAIILGRL